MRFHIYSCQINCVGMCPFSFTAVIECQFNGTVHGPAGEASLRDDIITADGICCWVGVYGGAVGGAEKCN